MSWTAFGSPSQYKDFNNLD